MTDFIKNLPFWDNLTEKEKDFALRNSVVRSFKKNTYLKDGCSQCLGMFYVIRGNVRALMISEEGRKITLFHLGAGDSCILSASCILSQLSFETEMVTTEDTEILLINTSAYGKLMEENLSVKCFTYELAAARSNAIIWVLQQILFAKFDQRLARFLLEKCESTGKNTFEMSKESIATEVNTAREVVSRMLKQFASDGIISMNQKTITVLDKKSLENIL